MKHVFIVSFFLCVFLVSCLDREKGTQWQAEIKNESIEAHIQGNNAEKESLLTNKVISVPQNEEAIVVLHQDDGLVQTLQYSSGFSLIIDLEDVWADSATLSSLPSDSVVLWLGLESKIEGYFMQFSVSKGDSLLAFEQYETSLTLMNEGPHYDLTDWKHYQSPWKPLTISAEGKTVTTRYSPTERERFPEVAMEELITVLKTEGAADEWITLAMDCTTPTNYPCGVSISKHRFRFEIIAPDGQITTHWLILHIPMGC